MQLTEILERSGICTWTYKYTIYTIWKILVVYSTDNKSNVTDKILTQRIKYIL